MRLATTLVATTVVLMTGCGATSTTPVAAGSDNGNSHVIVSGSRVRLFGNLPALAAGSRAVAIVDITKSLGSVPADEEGQSPVQASLVEASPVRVFGGRLPDKLVIRLIASTDPASEFPAPLQVGQRYVVFLVPFEFEPGKYTGQWTIPGAAGIYRVAGSTYTLVSRSDDPLPSSISDADLQQAASHVG